jgi:hypothetical protein
MSDLTLEELDELEAACEECLPIEWLKPLRRTVAAARAHLEQKQIARNLYDRLHPQPPQQREDDGSAIDDNSGVRTRHSPVRGAVSVSEVAPAPSSTVEPELTGPTGYHDSVSALLHRTGGADGDGGPSPAPSSTVKATVTSYAGGTMQVEWPDPDAGLVERLHRAAESKSALRDNDWALLVEAAAALEAKDAEIERLQKGWNFAECDSKEAQAEIERLRGLLCKAQFYFRGGRSEPFTLPDEIRAALKGGEG